MPGPGTGSLCFYSVQLVSCYILPFCALQVFNRNTCSSALGRLRTKACIILTSVFKQRIPANLNGSYAHKSLCSHMKERNDLVGAQGLQGVIAELSYSPQNSAAIYKILDGVNTAKKKKSGTRVHTHRCWAYSSCLRLVVSIAPVGVWCSMTEDLYIKGGIWRREVFKRGIYY